MALMHSFYRGPLMFWESGRRGHSDDAAEPDDPRQQLHSAQLQAQENVLPK